MTAREEIVSDLLDRLSLVEGWAVLKGWEALPAVTGDIDLIVDPAVTEMLLDEAGAFFDERLSAPATVVRCAHIPRVPRLLAISPELGGVLEVDFAEAVPTRGFDTVTFDRLRAFLESSPEGWPRTSTEAEAALQFLFKRVGWSRVDGAARISEGAWAVLEALLGRRRSAVIRNAPPGAASVGVLGVSASLLVAGLVRPTTVAERVRFRRPGSRSRSCAFDPRGSTPRGAGSATELRDSAASSPGHRIDVKGLADAPGRRRGAYVVVAGPDGAGKSTVCEALERMMSQTVVRRHHRPGVFPDRPAAAGGAKQVPHERAPYGLFGSLAKTGYLAAGFSAGWLVRIRPSVRSGDVYLLERGWPDVIVDPRRYRIALPGRLLEFVGRFLPAPDVLIVLDAPAEVVYGRKQELSEVELVRQGSAWRAMRVRPRCRKCVIDATRPADEVVRLAAAAIVGGRP